jgi:acyl carrier protein
VEQVLASMWSEILNADDIGAYDNFLTDLGGHSLIATQIISRVREIFKVEIPLRRLFETPTIAGLSEAILAVPGQRAKAERIAQIHLDIQQLSEQEVETMLLERSALVAEGEA